MQVNQLEQVHGARLIDRPRDGKRVAKVVSGADTESKRSSLALEALMRAASASFDRRPSQPGPSTSGALPLSPEPRDAPLFEKVLKWVTRQHLQGRMALWKASTLRVLEALCFRHGLGPVLNSEGWRYENLLSSDVNLELDALSDSDKVFLAEAMILWLYEFKKSQGKREEFSHALVIEEGHHILSQQKENAAGAETIMETCLRQIRDVSAGAKIPH